MERKDIETLDIDGKQYKVEDLSKEVQILVSRYNRWLAEEDEAQNELLKMQLAKAELGRQIVAAVRKEIAETAANEEADGQQAPNDVVDMPANGSAE